MRRLIARYAVELPESFEVITLFDDAEERERLDKARPLLRSIAPRYPAAIWFERKIADDFGIRIEGAFDRRPLVHQERFPADLHPMRKDFPAKTKLEPAPYRPYRYETVGGDGVFEVSVGPIHAGIIEPGHFHFSQAGEAILHQEVRHFYTHRAIEKMLEGKTPQEAAPIIARISGNESVAAQSAWLRIWAEAMGREIPQSLRRRHALWLELERLAHHLSDLGFIPNDAGFGAALAWGSQRSEEARRLMQALTGHRFGFDAVGFEAPSLDTRELQRWINRMKGEIEGFADWIVDVPSLWDRFDTTGILRPHKARKYGVVGVMARASGLRLDRRESPFYREHGFEIVTEESGDVAARFKVRLREAIISLRLMDSMMEAEVEALEPAPVRDGAYRAYVESSLGELLICAHFEGGRISRFFMRDPSFVNWQALHTMMPGNIIADFPLINKSCDLSYAGNDL